MGPVSAKPQPVEVNVNQTGSYILLLSNCDTKPSAKVAEGDGKSNSMKQESGDCAVVSDLQWLQLCNLDLFLVCVCSIAILYDN